MLTEILKSLFKRDLLKLRTEIELYRDEANMWRVDKEISNSAGNLCLHLVGNLNTYIGVALAKTTYVRQRELEFSLKNVPRLELIQKIDEVINVVEKGLNGLDENQLDEDFPMMIGNEPTQMGFTLVHLAMHLSYHLGQINYHRRLLDNSD